MIGLILFDNHDDLLYVYSDKEFRKKIECVATKLDIIDGCHSPDQETEIESIVLMQIFSPLLTSYRVMNQEFQNSYDGITCDDGSTVAFYEEMDFLLIAVAKHSINAVHLVRVCYQIMQHVCGPSFSLLKHSNVHSELTTLLMETFLDMRQTCPVVVTESLHYEPMRDQVNSYMLRILQSAVVELKNDTHIPVNRVHILILKGTSIISIYSGEGASELKTKEILFLIILVAAYARNPSASTHNNLFILESCVPYRIHMKTFDNGLSILILVEAGIGEIAKSIHTLLKMLTTSKNLNSLKKQIGNVQKLARKLNRHEWSETLVWRPNLKLNSSALSSLARQIQYGFETICLDASLLFVAVEHITLAIEIVRSRIPVLGLAQPCHLSPMLKFYAGLVHFVLIDRKQHRMISPKLSVEPGTKTFSSDMWQVFHTSLEWLHEGIYQLMWNDRQFCYSHSIWVTDTTNEKMPWKFCWDIQTGTLGYPATIGSEYYENLLKMGVEDDEPEAANYFQLFCIHLGLTNPSIVLQQSTQIAMDLKAFICRPSYELEDIC